MKVISRAVDWCLENPKIFWTVVIIGGLGDLAYLIWYFSWVRCGARQRRGRGVWAPPGSSL